MQNIKIFIIHGFEGHPNGGWRPWLMSELEQKGVYCAALVMKSPDKPIAKDWVSEIESNVKKFPKDKIILIGHSLGVPAILGFLQKTKSKNILANILISGPYKDERKGKVKDMLKSFFPKVWDFKKIKKASNDFIIIHGSNDPMVHFSQAEFLKENLNAELICVKNGGHLNGSAGFYKLPELLESILKIVK